MIEETLTVEALRELIYKSPPFEQGGDCMDALDAIARTHFSWAFDENWSAINEFYTTLDLDRTDALYSAMCCRTLYVEAAHISEYESFVTRAVQKAMQKYPDEWYYSFYGIADKDGTIRNY